VVGDKSLLALLVGGLVGLLQVLHLLLGDVSLLEVVSKGGHRDILVLAFALEVLLYSHTQHSVEMTLNCCVQPDLTHKCLSTGGCCESRRS